MKIYIGADHAGFKMKEELQSWLKSEFGSDVIDIGTFDELPVDYPIVAREVSEKVFENPGARGILVCGSGQGMCISANKHKGVRAGLAESEERARAAREHNDINVLCLGSRFTDIEIAKKIVKIFLSTEFSKEERHQKRVALIES